MLGRTLSIASSFLLLMPQSITLTPTTGKLMLQQRVNSGQAYSVNYAKVARLIDEPSFINFSNSEDALFFGRTLLRECEPQVRSDYQFKRLCDDAIDNGPLALNRLIRAGLITQTETEVTLPDISGEYEGSMTGCFNVSLTINQSKALPRMSGNYKVVTATGYNTCTPINQVGTFNGVVSPPNKLLIALEPPLYRFPSGELVISTESGIRLTGNVKRYEVTGSYTYPVELGATESKGGQLITKQYRYRFVRGFDDLIMGKEAVKAGIIKIDRLENLLLDSTVEASASFYWHVDFNKAAQGLTGRLQQSGVGRASFRKQPDNRWVVTGYKLD